MSKSILMKPPRRWPMADPEISAMATIGGALDTLDEAARERVLRWARDRYGKPTASREVTAWGATSHRADTLPRDQGSSQYTDAADVYAAANPLTDGDKVLVVGYWFQVVRGDTELDSQSLNMELKNLGYPISNVTRAVSGLAKSIPRYLVQTKKSGSTKQARKRFRLTVEGVKRVEQMLGSAASTVRRAGGDDESLDGAGS
jgi:hypothetical protein